MAHVPFFVSGRQRVVIQDDPSEPFPAAVNLGSKGQVQFLTMSWVPSRGSCCVEARLRADPEGPGMVAGERKGEGAEPGVRAERHLGEPAQALPSTVQFPRPCPGAERRREHVRNRAPNPHWGATLLQPSWGQRHHC